MNSRQHPQAANAPEALLLVPKTTSRGVVRTISTREEFQALMGYDIGPFAFAPTTLVVLRAAPKYPHCQGEPIRLTDEQIAEWRRDQ